ncbi:MAG TPA: serine hydrolase domain-containing protein [Allosphingosinicella sp.]|jgi:CubicO group peptidase (beta-lactamase class C family)
MKWTLGLAACLLAAGSGASAQSLPARRATLDRDMPAILAKHKVPSVSVAHIEQGRIVLAASYGQQSAGVPATTDTLYNVASLTKPVSAETVLRLAAKGKLSLDEPMYTHWTDPDLTADPRHKLLTPRIGLSHRTGFPNWRFNLPDRKLAFTGTPGETIGYSGEGYEWVSRFAARKTGTDFETLAKTLIFDLAGMKNTSFTGRPWFAGRVATGSDTAGKPVEPFIRSDYRASDDLHTTASDYARFMIEAMKRKRLTPKLWAERQTVQASTWSTHCTGEKAKACPDELGFGLGWEVQRYGKEVILFHTGADEGEFTLAFFNPRTRTGTVVLTNSRNGALAIVDVLDRIGTDPKLLAFLHSQAHY